MHTVDGIIQIKYLHMYIPNSLGGSADIASFLFWALAFWSFSL